MKRRTPLLSDGPQELLDHLELAALSDSDRNASAAELWSDLELAGSTDAMEEDEDTQTTEFQRLEGIVDAVFTEAEVRIRGCSERNYPFQLQRKAILSQDDDRSRVYTFLLFLSAFGESAIPKLDAAKLFEDVCAHASKIYFGSNLEPAESHVFGFPRRLGPRDFLGALEDLCLNRLREGVPDNKMPGASSMKDAGLDIVTWKPFVDRRSSQLIAFGQCATGQNWWDKRYELQPSDWCKTWLSKQPQVYPVKMFFVPYAVCDDDWAVLGHQAGIIFDRLRIAHFAEQTLPTAVRQQIQVWNQTVASELGA